MKLKKEKKQGQRQNKCERLHEISKVYETVSSVF